MSSTIEYRLDKILYVLMLALAAVLPFSRGGANTISGLIFVIFVVKLIVEKDRLWFRRFEYLPFLNFVIIGVVTALMAVDIREGISSFVSPILKYVIIFFAVAYTVRTEEQLHKLVKVLVVAGLIVSGYGIFQHFFGLVDRISSSLSNPNGAGSYLMMVTILNLSMLLISQNALAKVMFALTTLVASIATVFTMSRGALMGLGGAFIVLLLILVRFCDIKKIISILMVFIVLIAMFFPEQVRDRFAMSFNFNNESNKQRIYMLQVGWEMFKESPYLGKGPGNFEDLWEDYKPQHAEEFKHPHNIYLLILVEMGIAGLFAYIWVLVTLFKRSFTIIRSCPFNIQWAITTTALLSFIALSIHGFVDATLKDVQVGLLICIFAGLLFRPIPIIQEDYLR